MSKLVAKFAGCYNKIKKNQESGTREDDFTRKVHILYESDAHHNKEKKWDIEMYE